MLNIERSFKVALTKRGLTQAKLATAMGISTTSLSKLIHAKRVNVSRLDEAIQILGFTPSEFIALGEE